MREGEGERMIEKGRERGKIEEEEGRKRVGEIE